MNQQMKTHPYQCKKAIKNIINSLQLANEAIEEEEEEEEVGEGGGEQQQSQFVATLSKHDQSLLSAAIIVFVQQEQHPHLRHEFEEKRHLLMLYANDLRRLKGFSDLKPNTKQIFIVCFYISMMISLMFI